MYEIIKRINTNNGDIMLKKILPYLIIIILYSIIIYKILDIKYINNDKYQNIYLNKINNIIYGTTPKRGKILDVNNKVLVDNIPIYNINYRLTSSNNLIDISYEINNLLNLDKEASIDELKDYYINYNDTTYLLTKDEQEKFKYRKITKKEVYNIIKERINDEVLKYSKEDSMAIHTYYLIQKGFASDTKLVKENVSYEECTKIIESDIIGLTCDISWQRDVKYDFFSSILGSIGHITKENKEHYLSKGYNIDDLVGLSGLEEYYDDTLKGKKAIYEVNKDNSLTLIQDEVPGQDLTLAIDIDLVSKSYEILKQYFEISDKLRNTDNFKESFIIISNPNTGEIVSLMGLRKVKINNEIRYQDISSLAMSSSYTVGSVVKGASHTVGYLNNLIDVGKKINDSCVKLYLIPMKCSYVRLGLVDDISALKMSSNYYQFITAIKSTGNKYHYNMKLDVDENNFNTYRDIFKKYGLGSLSNIDFNNETTGIMGKKIAPDLLLNLAIGQYDSYTPISLVSYINTIALRGKRTSLSFKKQNNEVIDNVNLDGRYMSRIVEGFKQVLNYGTGKSYVDPKYNGAGKTGTAQVALDKNTISINSTFVMFAPVDNPRYSVVVLTPNVSYESDNSYTAPINQMISKSITNYLFENY